jgi:hypothetical protein
MKCPTQGLLSEVLLRFDCVAEPVGPTPIGKHSEDGPRQFGNLDDGFRIFQFELGGFVEIARESR